MYEKNYDDHTYSNYVLSCYLLEKARIGVIKECWWVRKVQLNPRLNPLFTPSTHVGY